MQYIYPRLSLVSYSFGWKVGPVEFWPTKPLFLPPFSIRTGVCGCDIG